MRDSNRQYFSKDDAKACLHIKFIQFLLDNFESKEYRVDMYVYYEDCRAIVVEWVRQLLDYIDDMGQFVFIAGDEHIEKDINENCISSKADIHEQPMKYFIVSDIHSFYTKLKRALDKAGFNKRNKDHTLIVCGDIFDYGPDIRSVYKFLTPIPNRA